MANNFENETLGHFLTAQYDSFNDSSAGTPKIVSIWILSFLYIAIFLVGLIGNTGVVLIYLRCRKIRTPTNRFIANLSLSDLLVIIFFVPVALVNNFHNDWVPEAYFCKILSYVQGISVTSSVFTLIAISIDRSRAITSPLTYRMRTRTYRIIMLLIWTISLLLNLPWLFVYGLKEFGAESCCMETWSDTNSESLYFIIVNLIICYIGPVIVLAICYSIILKRIRKQKTLHQNSKEAFQRNRIKALKMVITLIVTFGLTWFPLYTLISLLKFTDLQIPYNHLFPWFQCLGTSNSAINPFLYVYMSAKYRRELKKIFKRPNSFTPANQINMISLRRNESLY